MPRHRWKHRMYRDLAADAPSILDEIRKTATDLGLSSAAARPSETRSASGNWSLDRIRELVKARYSDQYDCCIVETPYSGLWAACHASFAEARFRHSFLPRCLTPRQKGLGVPVATLPPKYKHVYGSRHPGQAPGFDVVVVPLQGAVYANHGPSNSPVALLAAANPEPSLEVIAAAAEVHAPLLAGVYAQGPSTPGCGFGPLDEDGVHVLYGGLSELAAEFDVPYVLDEAYALPLAGEIGTAGSSVAVYGHSALGGLGMAIGTEDLLAPLLKNAPFAPADTDLALVGDLLTGLTGEREGFRRDLTRLYEAVTGALRKLDAPFCDALRVRKDLPSLSVEVNYEDTWREGVGFPIFTPEDSQSGTNLLESGVSAMDLSLVTVMEASITVHLPDPVTGRSAFHEERAALELNGLVRLLEILGKRSGYLD